MVTMALAAQPHSSLLMHDQGGVLVFVLTSALLTPLLEGQTTALGPVLGLRCEVRALPTFVCRKVTVPPGGVFI